MSTAQSISDAIASSLQKNKPEDLAIGGQIVLDKYGQFLSEYCRPIPIEFAAIRIWHETRGSAQARSREDERGLLQIYPWLRQKCGLSDKEAYDPQKNIACGCPDWVSRGEKLRSQNPQLRDVSGADFWGVSNLTMSIGAGATRLLVRHTGGGFYAIWDFVRNRPGEFAQLPRTWWGSQSPELVAKRIAATSRWLEAAELLKGPSFLFTVGAIWLAIYLIRKYS
jgi:hypothetical protein